MINDNHIPSQSPITLKEAAEIILRGLVSPRTLRTCVDRGELRAYKLGRTIVTTPDDLQEWMQKREYEPAPQFRLQRVPTQKYRPKSDAVERARQLLLNIKAEKLAKRKAERESLRLSNSPKS